MKTEHWEPIIAKHLDGVATAEEVADLSTAIESDESAKVVYLRMARVHAGLATSRVGSGNIVYLAENRSFWRAGWMKIAALVALGLTVFSTFWFGGNPIATITKLEGVVRWTGADGKEAYLDKPGVSLSGGTLETLTPDSTMTMHFEDGTTIAVSGRSNLLFSDQEGKFLSLREGMLFADVVPQASGRPLRLNTTSAELTILGTRFEVVADESETQLRVRQGQVEFLRVSDSDSVEVPAGYRTQASYALQTSLEVTVIPGPVWTWTADLRSDVDHGRWVPMEAILRIELGRDIESGLVQEKDANEVYAGRLANVRKGSGVIFAEPVRNQRQTLYFCSFSLQRHALGSVLLSEKARFRVQGKASSPSEIRIGVMATSPERSSPGRFTVERQVEGDFDIEVPVHELHTATQRAVGFELLSWFCFTTQREAKLAITGVEIIGN